MGEGGGDWGRGFGDFIFGIGRDFFDFPKLVSILCITTEEGITNYKRYCVLQGQVALQT